MSEDFEKSKKFWFGEIMFGWTHRGGGATRIEFKALTSLEQLDHALKVIREHFIILDKEFNKDG